MTTPSSTSVAIIGGSVSAMAAAYQLIRGKKYAVNIIEQGSRLGGHLAGFTLPGHSSYIDVDHWSYDRQREKKMTSFLQCVGAEPEPLSTAGSLVSQKNLLASIGNDGQLSLSSQALPPSWKNSWRDFQCTCDEILSESSFDNWTLDFFFQRYSYPEAFVQQLLMPLFHAYKAWPKCMPERCYMKPLVQFLRRWGIIPSPEKRDLVMIPGIARVAEKFRIWMEGQPHQNVMMQRKVVGIHRDHHFVRIRMVDSGWRTHSLDVDQVIFALHPKHILTLLQDTTLQEQQVLQRFSWEKRRFFLHQCASPPLPSGSFQKLTAAPLAMAHLGSSLDFYPKRDPSLASDDRRLCVSI